MRKLAFLLIAGFVGFSAYAEGQVINESVIECDGQQCAQRPRSSEIVGGCTEADYGKSCTQASGRAYQSVCVKITKEKGGDVTYSCAAKQCNDKYWLWVSGGHSMGVCHSIDETIRFCKKNGQCGDNCDCVPNEIPNPNPGYDGRAYDECICAPKEEAAQPETCDGYTQKDGKAWECCMQKKAGKNVDWNKTTGKCECVGDDVGKQWDWTKKECVGDETVDPNGKKCWYYFNAYVECGNTKVMMSNRAEITEKLARELGASCDDPQKIKVEDWIERDKVQFAELTKKWCADEAKKINADVDEARDRLDAFMRDTELNANVWKNAEGKFNTARLASDLTAGVVLGTVGGIVSANIIKKKQLEKGYDALHCTVGGQKVADWGDEFSVGLRRY